ncbi:MAG: hypothetical protein EOP05_02515 [Proteobacteria bacterium]|nr:MAG: hypothetical protein EOP05_02515 [Pseudomonadota bacterium]
MKETLALTACAGMLILCFQNCTPGFVTKNSESPTSIIAVGGESIIQTFSFNHAARSLKLIETLQLTGQSPGWLAIDSVHSSLLSADSRSAKLTSYQFDTETTLLGKPRLMSIPTPSVHFEMADFDGSTELFTSDYTGSFSRLSLGELGSSTAINQTLVFANNAQTHSSALDAANNLVFVANKGEGRIVIYKLELATLSELDEISIPGPRLLKFDQVYKQLYVITEANSGSGEVASYQVIEKLGSVTVAKTGSFVIGQRGSALAIDRNHGFLIATVRESGKEEIKMFPITSAGFADANRASASIGAPCIEARSLEASSDGLFYFLTCNDSANAEDLFVFEIHFDSENNFTAANLVAKSEAGPGEHLSQTVFER